MLYPSLRWLWLIALPLAASAAPVHHELRVELAPEAHLLRVWDRMTLPAATPGPVEFTLHADLAPSLEGGGKLVRVGREDGAVPMERFRVEPSMRTITVRYGGVIHHPLADVGQGVGHAMETTPGLIAQEGVILGGAAAWYPQFPDWPDVNLDLTVSLPPGWQAVSQGERSGSDAEVHWRETSPQEDIWLVAGAMTRYQRGEHPAAMVFLHTPDPALAETYLAATDRYLHLYSDLIGPYAYPKFALVENFWETGYGMPSFTLLGSRVIRLPFLLESSYPHEILHNWWGNGVYVDPAEGNWSEGLTAYLADHLLKEQAGHGAEYRRDQLQAYGDYVSSARDFPLAQFAARHSGATQAIGYGKGMMFFHMLRRELGDAKFVAGLRRFYQRKRFTPACFSDLRADFEAVSGRDLGPLFAQWVGRAGAPALALSDARFTASGVSITLEQSQADAPYALQVPVVATLSDGRAVERTVTMSGRRTTVALPLPGRAVCVAVDPRFDLFRRLSPGEQPVSLASAFGAGRLLILVPAAAPAPLRDAWAQLASAWAAGDSTVEVRRDSEMAALPQDRPVVLLGWENAHRQALPATIVPTEAHEVILESHPWPRQGNAFVVTERQQGRTLVWLGADDPSVVAALARKVPHYGKYGYLVFGGAEAAVRLKGQWPVQDSPLMRRAGDGHCAVGTESPLIR